MLPFWAIDNQNMCAVSSYINITSRTEQCMFSFLSHFYSLSTHALKYFQLTPLNLIFLTFFFFKLWESFLFLTLWENFFLLWDFFFRIKKTNTHTILKRRCQLHVNVWQLSDLVNSLLIVVAILLSWVLWSPWVFYQGLCTHVVKMAPCTYCYKSD